MVVVCSPHLGSVLCLCCGLQTCGLCESWIMCIFCADVSVCVCLCERGGSLGHRRCVLGGPGMFTTVCV